MSTKHPEDPSTTPTAEVVIRRDGAEIHRELCESAAEAAAIVAHWEEQRGVECEIVKLASRTDAEAAEVDWGEAETAYPGANPDMA